MIQLWAWEYHEKTEVGYQSTDNSYIFKAIDVLEIRHKAYLHNLRKVKVVDEDYEDESHTFVNDICRACAECPNCSHHFPERMM